MQLNKWVWTKAVRPSGKSSDSHENSRAASGQGKQASTTVEEYRSSAEKRYKVGTEIFLGGGVIRAVSGTTPRQMEHRRHVTGLNGVSWLSEWQKELCCMKMGMWDPKYLQ
jgi:hypothetical protein